jgi:hypothetical protein
MLLDGGGSTSDVCGGAPGSNIRGAMERRPLHADGESGRRPNGAVRLENRERAVRPSVVGQGRERELERTALRLGVDHQRTRRNPSRGVGGSAQPLGSQRAGAACDRQSEHDLTGHRCAGSGVCQLEPDGTVQACLPIRTCA